jgi:hypothetical protein
MICGKFVVGDCNVWVVVYVASWCDRACNITCTVLELNKMQGWIMVMCCIWCIICGEFVVGDCNVWVVVHIASWCDRVCNITSTVLELNKMQGWIMVMCCIWCIICGEFVVGDYKV